MTTQLTRPELQARIAKNPAIILVEALAEKYYRERHLPGALHLPHDQVRELAVSLLPDKQAEIVTYCASSNCQNSHIAAKVLTQMGYTNVSVYSGGKQDWIEAGLPVESALATASLERMAMPFTRVISIADYGATVLRVSLGVMYLAHAHLKIFTFTLGGTADFFTKVGFPGWMAYPVTFAELAAGVALIIGWNARWVALALTPVLIGAAITHWPNGWVHVSAGGGWEYPVFLIAASITLGLIGNGAWALETGSGRISMPRTSNQRAGI